MLQRAGFPKRKPVLLKGLELSLSISGDIERKMYRVQATGAQTVRTSDTNRPGPTADVVAVGRRTVRTSSGSGPSSMIAHVRINPKIRFDGLRGASHFPPGVAKRSLVVDERQRDLAGNIFDYHYFNIIFSVYPKFER